METAHSFGTILADYHRIFGIFHAVPTAIGTFSHVSGTDDGAFRAAKQRNRWLVVFCFGPVDWRGFSFRRQKEGKNMKYAQKCAKSLQMSNLALTFASEMKKRITAMTNNTASYHYYYYRTALWG